MSHSVVSNGRSGLTDNQDIGRHVARRRDSVPELHLDKDCEFSARGPVGCPPFALQCFVTLYSLLLGPDYLTPCIDASDYLVNLSSGLLNPPLRFMYCRHVRSLCTLDVAPSYCPVDLP